MDKWIEIRSDAAVNPTIHSSKNPILNPAERPSRLPVLIHLLILATLAMSFVSGGLFWYGQTLNAQNGNDNFNVHVWLLLHGYLNPVLCIIFGYLLTQHIRYGWAMRANWLSGAIMEAVFALQIVTGVLLYYAGDSWRASIVQVHHIAGLLLPLALISHWIASQFWVRRNQNSV